MKRFVLILFILLFIGRDSFAQSSNQVVAFPSGTPVYACTSYSPISSCTSGGGGSNAYYTTTFTNTNLSSGVLTVNHNLGIKNVETDLYDNNGNWIVPDQITLTNINSLSVSLVSYGTISGTWTVVVLAAGGSGGGSGTVTSVGLSTPNSTLTLGGTNPVTTSGTISADINLGNINIWTGLQTFNNTNYVQENASNGTSITPTGNYEITYQANTQSVGTLTINNPTNTPSNWQALIIAISSSNVQTFSWGNKYDGGSIGLPSATTGSSKTDVFSFEYDPNNSMWEYRGSNYGY